MPNSCTGKLDGSTAFRTRTKRKDPSVDSSTDVPATADASPEVQADFTGASRDGMQDELATTTKTNTNKLDGLTTNRIWTRWTYSSPARVWASWADSRHNRVRTWGSIYK
ncbi:hypothetical protein F442_21337 [Phytophthora nicotianae P10297]|uniref:Uncharacterized protein n=1 Tax=Phytophthora nicotianae P10297 TaxID=1317064 RepID=W2Y319_PHYNI|nr:hypothetical protein F442_21337 [Phytophthora nicotianae P10297]